MTRSPTSQSLTLARFRHMKQGGGATVIWAVLAYVAAGFIVNAIIDRWHPRNGEKLPQQVWEKKRKRLRELAASEPDNSLLVMLGSSRTEGAFQARQVNDLPDASGTKLRAYNCGVPAAGPLHELLFLREMLDAGVRPRLLLVEFLPPLLNRPQRGLTSEEGWLLPGELSTSHLLNLWPYLARKAHIRRQWLQACIAPCYARRNDMHVHMRQQLSLEPPGPRRPHYPSGELLDAPPPEDWPRRHQIAIDMYRASLQRFEIGDGPVRAVRDLLECCREEQIPVVFVLMPESTVFRSWYTSKGLAESRRLLSELSDDYGVKVIDGTEWVTDDDFFDGHHVLPRGGEVFTKRLIEALRPIVAQRP